MKKFIKQLQEQFKKMCQTGQLFVSNVPGSKVWEIYLESFPEKYRVVFRDPESSSHNCNTCKSFVKRYGNILAIDENGSIMSIFSNLEDVDEEYLPSVKAVSSLLEGSKIRNVFLESYEELKKLPYEKCSTTKEEYQLGTPHHLVQYTKEEVDAYPGKVTGDKIYEFNHLNLQLPKVFVDFSKRSVQAIQADYRTNMAVLERGLIEISEDTLVLVIDLINQGSLLDGNAHLHSVVEALALKKRFDLEVKEVKQSEIWCWKESYSLDTRVCKFRNTLIGVLCTELSEGMELNKACLLWNKRVDPANYNKATSPVTAKQVKQAHADFLELGYKESDLARSLANLDDIKVSEVLHTNVGTGETPAISIFDSVATSASSRHKRSEFSKVQEVTIATFMKDILPSCTSLEAFMENKFEGNLCVITKNAEEEGKQLFKWNNPFSWTFKGNLAGKSQIKQAVKTAGGAVNGVLRFSIMWAKGDGDNSDLDAHCNEPLLNKDIYFGNKTSRTGGVLDIDITAPRHQMPTGAVENITYPSTDKMPNGDYVFKVNQFHTSNSKGFKAEIEFDGQIFQYKHEGQVYGMNNVATVTLKDGEFSIKHHMPEATSSKTIWGVNTEEFHKVTLACVSPNHWGENKVGNLHYMFMLDKCRAEGSIRGFHNENLTADLLKNRKVMEVLGNKTMIEAKGNHLAGLGFNSTVNEELIVRCKGSHNRMVKIKF